MILKISKNVPKAYLCPKCRNIMHPHDGPWAVVHCFSCEISCDLWYETPETIEVDVAPQPRKPELVIIPIKHTDRVSNHMSKNWLETIKRFFQSFV